jgi:hypothetical protein
MHQKQGRVVLAKLSLCDIFREPGSKLHLLANEEMSVRCLLLTNIGANFLYRAEPDPVPRILQILA